MSKDERIQFLCEQLRTRYKQWFSLTDVVNDLHIPKSSAHRLLKALVKDGCLEYFEKTHVYKVVQV